MIYPSIDRYFKFGEFEVAGQAPNYCLITGEGFKNFYTRQFIVIRNAERVATVEFFLEDFIKLETFRKFLLDHPNATGWLFSYAKREKVVG